MLKSWLSGFETKMIRVRVNPFFNQLEYRNGCSFAEIFGLRPDLTFSEFVHFSSEKRLEVS